MDKKPLIGLSICAVVFLIMASLTNVVGYQTVKSSNQQTIDEKSNLLSNRGLIDNVTNECYGTYLTDIPLILLGIGVNFIRIEQSNHNDIPVNIEISVRLETHNGKVLIEFDDVFQTGSFELTVLCLFTRYDWKYFHYRFGFFDLTLDVTIREDGSHEKLVFHGFVYGCGAKIFNPKGEVIE